MSDIISFQAAFSLWCCDLAKDEILPYWITFINHLRKKSEQIETVRDDLRLESHFAQFVCFLENFSASHSFKTWNVINRNVRMYDLVWSLKETSWEILIKLVTALCGIFNFIVTIVCDCFLILPNYNWEFYWAHNVFNSLQEL